METSIMTEDAADGASQYASFHDDQLEEWILRLWELHFFIKNQKARGFVVQAISALADEAKASCG